MLFCTTRHGARGPKHDPEDQQHQRCLREVKEDERKDGKGDNPRFGIIETCCPTQLNGRLPSKRGSDQPNHGSRSNGAGNHGRKREIRVKQNRSGHHTTKGQKVILVLHQRRFTSIERSETENKEQGEYTERNHHIQRANHHGFCFNFLPVDFIETVQSFVLWMEKEMSQQTCFPIPCLSYRSFFR